MIKYNSYNWLPSVADVVLDYPRHVYDSAGVVPNHNYPYTPPAEIRTGSKVFVKSDFFLSGHFFSFLNEVKNPFYLFTGVSDYCIADEIGNTLYEKTVSDKRIIKWFGHNMKILGEKTFPIPIGFPEKERNNGNQQMLEQISLRNKEGKKDKVYLPYHNFKNNPKREQDYNSLKKISFVDTERNRISIEEYYRKLEDYKYVICLQGNGYDTHRIYETLLAGSIPVVYDNPTVSEMLELYGCDFIESCCPADLLKKYERRIDIQYGNNHAGNIVLTENIRKKILSFIK